MVIFGLFVLITVHTYNQRSVSNFNYNYQHDHHAGEGDFFVPHVAAGSKKLQQSSNYLPEDEGVKFLPVLRYKLLVNKSLLCTTAFFVN